MADKPILFSGPMVRALLASTKTQTRRVCALPEASGEIRDMVKVATDAQTGRSIYEMKDAAGKHVTIRESKHFITPQFSPRIAVGDRLYVREHWRTTNLLNDFAPRDLINGDGLHIEFIADGQSRQLGKFRQGMHMPRWASRITLTVTDVRVERLQDISEGDAKAEGAKFFVPANHLSHGGWSHDEWYVSETAKLSYEGLWDRINGPGAWALNPWVAAYTFTVQMGNIDQLEAA